LPLDYRSSGVFYFFHKKVMCIAPGCVLLYMTLTGLFQLCVLEKQKRRRTGTGRPWLSNKPWPTRRRVEGAGKVAGRLPPNVPTDLKEWTPPEMAIPSYTWTEREGKRKTGRGSRGRGHHLRHEARRKTAARLRRVSLLPKGPLPAADSLAWGTHGSSVGDRDIGGESALSAFLLSSPFRWRKDVRLMTDVEYAEITDPSRRNLLVKRVMEVRKGNSVAVKQALNYINALVRFGKPGIGKAWYTDEEEGEFRQRRVESTPLSGNSVLARNTYVRRNNPGGGTAFVAQGSSSLFDGG